MKSKLLLISALIASGFAAKAQDTIKVTGDAPLVIYGSVDTYYKADFSGHKNIGTSFASDNNSVSIGMFDLGLKKKVGKASFVGELSFGPRGQYQSIPNGDGDAGNAGNSFNIQNLYVSYDVTDKFNLTAGYMSTFVGYEVIAPTGNFNYSTSYLFTSGPFQNAGFKATYAFSDKVSLMVGAFNDRWNVYTSDRDVSTFGAQLMLAPVKGWTVYLNGSTSPLAGTIFDLTTAYQITDAFKLGLNAAKFSNAHFGGGYDGVAVYPQYAVSKVATLGIRYEYFETQATSAAKKQNVSGITATANFKSGPLTFIPEIRFDSFGDKAYTSFTDSKNAATTSAAQFSLAAVYAF